MIPRRPKSGFTLLEIMAALAIVAVALVTLLGSHLISLDLAQKHEEQSLAAMLGREMIQDSLTIPYDELISDSGDFGPEHPQIQWKIEVSDADIDNLKEVIITIRLPGGDFALGTLIARTESQ